MKKLRLILVLWLFASPLLQAEPSPMVDSAAVSRQIDALLEKDWSANKLTKNPPATDEVFVRRVYLDVVGRIPTFRETEAFLGSTKTDKRGELIDRLLASEGYVSNFYNYWSDILRNHSARLGGTMGTAYSLYLKESLRTNKPYDRFVREHLSAQGNGWDNGAIAYYLRDVGMPLDNMANTVRVFLGTRIECAQCHDHPFDKWTQKQFYQMAAFSFGVGDPGYSSGPMSRTMKNLKTEEAAMREKIRLARGHPSPELLAEQKEQDRHFRLTYGALYSTWASLYYSTLGYSDRPLQLPHDYKYGDGKPRDVVQPATMMGKPLTVPPGSPPLVDFANWMTAPENPRFTRVIANRLWKKVFGLGLIEPVDELKDDTVAVNPELMAHLERLMVSVNYDMRAYLRALLNTQAYQSCVTPEEIRPGATDHFTGPVLRRMSAEQMWDSFVTLINPTPDVPNLEARDQQKRRMLTAKKLYDALDALGQEELERRLVAAGSRNGAAVDESIAMQKEIVQARAKGDKAKVEALMKQSEPMRRNNQQSVNEEVLMPALSALTAKVTGNGTLPKLDKPLTDPIAQIPVPGCELPKDNPALVEATRQNREMQAELALYFGIPEKERIYFPGICAQAARRWPRASEVGSPAPRGHYLRIFGQSDREVIENASRDASVPQALTLMNSDLLLAVMDAKSQLMLAINRHADSEAKLDAAYLSMFSRKPTDGERRVWRDEQARGLDSMEDLIYALINTRQFLFIQ